MSQVEVKKDLENKTLVVACTFLAGKQKVWQAYADKELFEKWWGPEGWQTTVKEFDFRPGGRNLYGMKCIDESQGEWFGQTSWGLMEYQAISEPDSFTYKDLFANEDGSVQDNMPGLVMEITLQEADGRTTVTSTVQAESVEALEQLLKMGMVEGYSSSCNKLEQLLSEQ